MNHTAHSEHYMGTGYVFFFDNIIIAVVEKNKGPRKVSENFFVNKEPHAVNLSKVYFKGQC